MNSHKDTLGVSGNRLCVLHCETNTSAFSNPVSKSIFKTLEIRLTSGKMKTDTLQTWEKKALSDKSYHVRIRTQGNVSQKLVVDAGRNKNKNNGRSQMLHTRVRTKPYFTTIQDKLMFSTLTISSVLYLP